MPLLLGITSYLVISVHNVCSPEEQLAISSEISSCHRVVIQHLSPSLSPASREQLWGNTPFSRGRTSTETSISSRRAVLTSFCEDHKVTRGFLCEMILPCSCWCPPGLPPHGLSLGRSLIPRLGPDATAPSGAVRRRSRWSCVALQPKCCPLPALSIFLPCSSVFMPCLVMALVWGHWNETRRFILFSKSGRLPGPVSSSFFTYLILSPRPSLIVNTCVVVGAWRPEADGGVL